MLPKVIYSERIQKMMRANDRRLQIREQTEERRGRSRSKDLADGDDQIVTKNIGKDDSKFRMI